MRLPLKRLAVWVMGGLIILTCPSLPASAASAFQILHKLNDAPGNITVTPSGRVIMSLHQFYEPEVSVVELTKDGALAPFPNQVLNERSSHDKLHLDSVLGLRADKDDVVWMLDNGLRSKTTPKLVAWDTRHNVLARTIELLPPVVPPDQFVNDFAIDPKRNAIYMADPAGGRVPLHAIVVVSDEKLKGVLGRPDFSQTSQPIVALALEKMRSENGGLLVQLTSDHTAAVAEVPAKRNVQRRNEAWDSNDTRLFFEYPGDWMLPWRFGTSDACHDNIVNGRTFCGQEKSNGYVSITRVAR